MKQYTLLLWALCVCFFAQAQSSLQLTPQKPQPGTAITITYNPSKTVLSGAKDIEAVAYLLEGKMPLAQAIILTPANGSYTGTVSTNDSTRAVFFTFSHGDQYDNNNDSGYYTLLYDRAVP